MITAYSVRAEFTSSRDEVAEWLRRWTANPMCSARVGSNPILVGSALFSAKDEGVPRNAYHTKTINESK